MQLDWTPWWALVVFCSIFRVSYVYYHVIYKQGQFYFFSSLDSFYFFSSVIAMARTSKTVLSKIDDSEYYCLFPGLRMLSAFFSPLRMIITVGLSYMPLLCWGKLPLFPLSGGFFSYVNVEFYQKLFLYILRGSYGFYSSIC